MGLCTMLGKMWSRLRAGLVRDVPPSIEACESCRELDCTQEMWQSCAQRLATEAVLLHGAEALAPHVAKSAELPELDASPDAVIESELDESPSERRRKLSSC
jgi:hypothetical protein